MPIGISPCSTLSSALTLDDRALIDRGLREHGFRLSEYSFANLYLFREVHRYHLQTESMPCISGLTYDGHSHLLPLFDLSRVSPVTLRARLADHDFYYPVSDKVAAEIDTASFRMESNADDSDYLYASAKLAAYSGTRLAKKANLARQFERDAQPRFDSMQPADTGDALEVLDVWLAGSGKPAAATDHAQCCMAIQTRGALGLEGCIARARNGRPAGFLLYSEVWPDTLAVHFAKGSREHVGVYPYMFQQLAINVQGRYPYLNFEQDLGNPGFRQNKRSFAPLQQLKKVRVRPR